MPFAFLLVRLLYSFILKNDISEINFKKIRLSFSLSFIYSKITGRAPFTATVDTFRMWFLPFFVSFKCLKFWQGRRISVISVPALVKVQVCFWGVCASLKVVLMLHLCPRQMSRLEKIRIPKCPSVPVWFDRLTVPNYY